MTFPFLAEDNLATSTVNTTVWNGTNVDTQSKRNIRHYSYLAGHGARLELPFQGAYAHHIDLSLGTADAYLESTLWATALNGTIHTRFYFYARGLVMAASDRFTLLMLHSVGPVVEGVIDLRNNAGVLELVTTELHADAPTVIAQLIQNQWHCVELLSEVDAGAGNDGSHQLFVDGYAIGTVGSLDQAAFTQARLGAMNIDAGTTAGHVLFGGIIADETRIFPVRTRFSNQQYLTRSGHVFTGPGQLQDVTLLAGAATDNALICYDTDEANTNDPSTIIVPELRNAQGASDTVVYRVPHGQGEFQRGCYVALSGTNPRALVTARRATSGLPALRSYAAQRPGHGAI